MLLGGVSLVAALPAVESTVVVAEVRVVADVLPADGSSAEALLTIELEGKGRQLLGGLAEDNPSAFCVESERHRPTLHRPTLHRPEELESTVPVPLVLQHVAAEPTALRALLGAQRMEPVRELG